MSFKKGYVPWNKGKSSWNRGKRYITAERVKIPQRFCVCGCGELLEERLVLKSNKRKFVFKLGHHNKVRSKETCKRLSKSIKDSFMNRKSWNFGLNKNNDIRIFESGKNISKSLNRQETIVLKSNISKNLWNNKNYLKKIIPAFIKRGKRMWQDENYAKYMFERQGRKPNDEELYLDAILQLNFKNRFKYIGDGAVWFNGMNPDWIDTLNEDNVIEYNGYLLRHTKDFDNNRTLKFKSINKRVLHIYKNDFKSIETLVSKINNFIGEICVVV